MNNPYFPEFRSYKELPRFPIRKTSGEFIRNTIIQSFRKKILEIIEYHDSKDQMNESFILSSSRITNLPVSQDILLNRIERIRRTQELLDQFMDDVIEKFPEEQDQRQIFNMLMLAFEVHIDQKDRLEGQPVIGHVLEVAYKLLHEYTDNPDKKLVIAALLHDTIEDNPLYLAQKRHLIKNTSKEFIENTALKNIEFLIHGNIEDTQSQEFKDAQEISHIVSMVSKPDFETLIRDQQITGRKASLRKIKNELYAEYIRLVCEDPSALVVKYMDFEINAIDIIHRFPEETEKQITKKHHQMRKYYKAFPVFLNAFQSLPANHYLFSFRDIILQKLNDAHAHYTAYFQKAQIPKTAL